MAINDVLPEPLPAEPLQIAAAWLAEATRRAEQPNPNAMVLATASADGQPSARVVLCKGIVADPGYVHFVSNYHSRKGMDLAANPRAALVMHWDHSHRQLRMEGLIRRNSAAESDAYFAQRPWQSQLGAHASQQSEPIASRAELIEKLDAVTRQFGAAPSASGPGIPRPAHWGGYQLWVTAVELWVEGDARIHDRARWTRTLSFDASGTARIGAWSSTRLQP
jgi:pyridoxamine 5'-phosphate oxidase